MKRLNTGYYFHKLYNKKRHSPLNGQIELTYRCNLNCIHCYCKGLEVRDQRSENRELTTSEVKKILDEIHKEGCLFLTLTGGDPLVRDDFLELYSYAKAKGFLITIFTNGLLITKEILEHLVKFPPNSIEITLNGITKPTYETITQIEGSFSKVLENIKKIKERNLPLILKSNCLRQNKDEIAKIKAFVDKFLGRGKGKYHFKYDPMIYPRLNGDRSVCDFRLSFQELLELKKQDQDIWREFQQQLHCDFPDLHRDSDYLYLCNAWMKNFFINPYGRLQFCSFFDKFSVDLKTTSFREGFYEVFPKVLDEKFKTASKCRNCSLKPICYNCPARAYVETGSEEEPVEYYCELARLTAEQMSSYQATVQRNTSQVPG